LKKDHKKDIFTIIKAGFTLLIVLATLLGMIAVGWIFYNDLFGTVEDVTVPSVVNLDMVEARHKLESAGLIMETQESYHDKVPKDMVISQKPEGGKSVKEGRKVFVTVSLGGELVTVPNLKGLVAREGENKLAELELKYLVEKEDAHETIPAGKIIDQNPPAFTLVTKNTTVQVILSSGPETPRDIPELVGLTFDEAKKAIEVSGFVLGKVVWMDDRRFPEGTVITQLPLPKGEYKPGSLVSLEVVAGKSAENIIFQQDLITIIVPKSEKDVEVEVFLMDRYGKWRVYKAFHRGGQKFELQVSSAGGGKVEIFFDGGIGARADL